MIEKLSIQLVRYKLPLLIFVAVLAIVFPMVIVVIRRASTFILVSL